MYRELGDGHWLSDKIEDKEVFPVGGYISGSLTEYMKVDADIFQIFFDRVALNKEKVEKNKDFQKWFQERKTDFDFSLFCHIYAFDRLIRQTFPDATQNANKRVGFYRGKGKRNLSEGMTQGYVACNEFSILAQLYFQSQNIPTRYVGGELVHKGDFDDFESHSFIVFQSKGKDYVYDPVNQLSQKVPRIAEFVGPKENYFLETKNLFNADKWYYAAGDKGAFLKHMPEGRALRDTLKKACRKKQIKAKEKQNV